MEGSAEKPAQDVMAGPSQGVGAGLDGEASGAESEDLGGPRGLSQLPWYAVPLTIAILVAGLGLATIVEPSLQDEVVWRYYWGPIKADAMDCPSASSAVPDRCAEPGDGGVIAKSGYNVVNTASWVVLFALGIVAYAQIVVHYGRTMGIRETLVIVPWILAAASFHVLEDAGLFAPPLQYFFITPILFVTPSVVGMGGFAFLEGLQPRARRNLQGALNVVTVVLGALLLGYIALWAKAWGGLSHYLHPVLVTAFVLVALYFLRRRSMRMHRLDTVEGAAVWLGVPWFLICGAYLAWYVARPWGPSGRGVPSAWVLVPLLAAGVTLAYAWLLRRSTVGAAASSPLLPRQRWIDFVVVFSLLVDGFATALAIDVAGYQEKHVASAALIDAARALFQDWGWAWGGAHPTFLAFVPVKLAQGVAAVWVIGWLERSDPRNVPFTGLLRFGAILVALGPGWRDALRLSLGV